MQERGLGAKPTSLEKLNSVTGSVMFFTHFPAFHTYLPLPKPPLSQQVPLRLLG